MANSTLLNNKFLCTSIPSSNMKPIICKSGSVMLPPRSVSVISVKTPTELTTRHLYQLDTADNLPSGIIPLAVDHIIDHKYHKLLRIPLLSRENNIVQIPRKTIIDKLQPIDVAYSKVNKISWTADETTTMNCYIIFFFSINSNITYLTKCMNSNILNMQYLKIPIYFSTSSNMLHNVLKITPCPVFKHPDVLQK